MSLKAILCHERIIDYIFPMQSGEKMWRKMKIAIVGCDCVYLYRGIYSLEQQVQSISGGTKMLVHLKKKQRKKLLVSVKILYWQVCRTNVMLNMWRYK